MKKIIAKHNFVLNRIPYIENEEIKDLTYEQIVSLNEQGHIQPLDFKDLVEIKRELENKNRKEEL